MCDGERFGPHERNGHSPTPREFDIGPPPAELRQQITSLISAGCTLRTAARMLDLPPAMLRRAVERHEEFRREVLSAEARFEVRQLQRLDDAAQDKKNWRVAMWLLERRLPDRYGRSRPLTVKRRQLEPLTRALARAVADIVDDPDQRASLLQRLKGAVRDLATELSEDTQLDGP